MRLVLWVCAFMYWNPIVVLLQGWDGSEKSFLYKPFSPGLVLDTQNPRHLIYSSLYPESLSFYLFVSFLWFMERVFQDEKDFSEENSKIFLILLPLTSLSTNIEFSHNKCVYCKIWCVYKFWTGFIFICKNLIWNIEFPPPHFGIYANGKHI